MKLSHFAAVFVFIGFSGLASANPADYFFSIYGAKAKRFFNSLPKLTATCAYQENAVDANGNIADVLKLTIQGQDINSILCRHIGEATYACEASTLNNSSPCRTN